MPLAPLRFEACDEAPGAALAAVDAGLHSFNLAAAPLGEVQPLASLAYSESGAVIGGAVGRTWGECCELQQLWVDADHRRTGVATHLMNLFESRAMARGCRFFYLETFSFQAPDFYLRQGYAVVLQLDGFSAEIAKFVMVKRLDRSLAQAG